jgi:hypothetical protein
MYWKRACHFIQSLAVMKQLFIRGKNISRAAPILVKRFGAHLLGALSMIFCIADAAQNIARRQAIVLDLQLGHDQFYCGKLIVIVIDREISGKSCRSRLAPQQPRAERMKRRKPGLRGRNSRAQQKLRDAIAHLFRGFVCEGHGKNGLSRYTVGDQIRHAVSDGPGLAGTGARED